MDAIDPLELRNTLGVFPTGVCLVTVADEGGEHRALTANSFAAVSLDPPLVLWSIQRTSEVYDAFVHSPRFAINFLHGEQEALSVRYAKKDDHIMAPAHYRPGENGAPVVEGALAYFECSVHDTVEAGDHTIIIGQVTQHRRADTSGQPLVFYSGAYRELKP